MDTPDQSPQDVLREEILGDARRQAEQALRRARQDAAALIARAEAEAARERTRILDQARSSAEHRIALVLARIPVETGRMRAARVESLLQSIHDETLRRLKARAGVVSRDTLVRLAAEAARGMEGDCFVMDLTAADRRELGADWLPDVRRLAGKPSLEIQPVETPGDEPGPILRDRAGRQVWDNRLSARLHRLWPSLRIDIAARTALLDTHSAAENPS